MFYCILSGQLAGADADHVAALTETGGALTFLYVS